MAFTDAAAGSSAGAQDDSDDISLFLRHLLHRPSSSSSSPHPPPPPPLSSALPSTSTPVIPTFPPMGVHAPDHLLPCFSSLPISTNRSHLHQLPTLSSIFSGSDRLTVNRTSDDTLTGVVLTSPAAYGSNLSSESLTGSGPMRSFDNEYGEECDCESERRRSRINEKMKALQNLIPNSNKTDKASMLDEAIEYLKQLQLQVQMLSMRNGLSLHPMCLPGVSGLIHPTELSQMGLDFRSRGRSLDVNVSNELTTMPARSHAVFNTAKQCLSPTRPSLPSVASVMSIDPSSYRTDSCIQDNFGPVQLHNYTQVECRNFRSQDERLTIK
ncbi:hypothetical protein Cgig2_008001 [Carnegiea gigantea]|uniref:BHLH domain-containing protein n=1 Tax=Carnegiea gigantea TaxID=171969 RepID=A0A9Q1QSQ0_9CARY|nr:hypothetical protein Cgig2_008001 [Carnegiea gigantea]